MKLLRKIMCWMGWHKAKYYKEKCHCYDMAAYWEMRNVVTVCSNIYGYHWKAKCRHCGKQLWVSLEG